MRRHALARQRTPPDTAPRNEALGAQWRAGYAKLEEVGFSFDMQLNPHQFAKAAALAKAHPGVPVIPEAMCRSPFCRRTLKPLVAIILFGNSVVLVVVRRQERGKNLAPSS